jgi:adenine phosphoribosyltransferase
MSAEIDLSTFIRPIPDFPKPGILFRDITPLLSSPAAFEVAVQRMAEPLRDLRIDALVAAEARGFIFAAPMALALGVAFVPVRKPGKLPFETLSLEYQLEYGTDCLEMHVDAVTHGQRVVVVDDLLATGGTVEACCQLLERCQAEVIGCSFCIELQGLGGRQRLRHYPVHSLLQY